MQTNTWLATRSADALLCVLSSEPDPTTAASAVERVRVSFDGGQEHPSLTDPALRALIFRIGVCEVRSGRDCRVYRLRPGRFDALRTGDVPTKTGDVFALCSEDPGPALDHHQLGTISCESPELAAKVLVEAIHAAFPDANVVGHVVGAAGI